MKSDSPTPWFTPRESTDATRETGWESFTATPSTAGPWSPAAQHGGPPAALLARALEGLLASADRAERVVARFTMDLLGPLPVGDVSVRSGVLRPGRTVSLLEAELRDDDSGRIAARAQAWAFPRHEEGPGPTHPLAHSPADGHLEAVPTSWSRGYLDAVEWRWIEGAVTRPGPGTVWMRPRVPLVPGEPMTGLQRLLGCIDSASGVSAALDVADWSFMNTELTVQMVREPVGEWICLQAETTLGPGSVGIALSSAYDERGLVGHSSQTLLVVPREPAE